MKIDPNAPAHPANIADEISAAEHAWRVKHRQSPKVLRLSPGYMARLKVHCERLAGVALSGPHQGRPCYAGMEIEVVDGMEPIGFALIEALNKETKNAP